MSGQLQHSTKREEVALRPDAIFALKFLDDPPGHDTATFCFELDTGAMAHLAYFKKLHAYWHIQQANGLYGLPEFRVVTSTNSLERVQNMRSFIREKWGQLKTPPTSKDHRRFLFCADSDYTLEQPETIFGPIFRNLLQDEPRSLVPRKYL